MKTMDTRLRARRAPFGFPAEGTLGPGKSRLPSKVNAIIETAIKKIYLTDVAAVIEEVQLQRTHPPYCARKSRRPLSHIPDRFKAFLAPTRRTDSNLTN